MIILLLLLLSLKLYTHLCYRLDIATEEGLRHAEHHDVKREFSKSEIVPDFCKLGHICVYIPMHVSL